MSAAFEIYKRRWPRERVIIELSHRFVSTVAKAQAEPANRVFVNAPSA